MYEQEYVRKRKRKRIAAIVGGISSVVVISFAIIAFLGRFVGTFTVSLESKDVTLTLYENSKSQERSSFLRVDVVAPFHEITYSDFGTIYGGNEELDSEDNTYEYGAEMVDGKVDSFNFFKYTFYLENYGTKDLRFDWRLNILDDVKSINNVSLLDTLRVIVFVDGADDVYGKPLAEPHYDNPKGEADYRPPVSVSKEQQSDTFPFMGYAKTFYSSDVVAAFIGQDIAGGQAIRYTIVAYLEGFLSNPSDFAPRGAQLKLGVDINAYEIK